MISSVRLRPLTWHPHIAPVELSEATPEQLDAMKVTPSSKKVSEYVRTLVHDPESYVARPCCSMRSCMSKAGLPVPIASLARLAPRSSMAANTAPLFTPASMHI